MNTFNKKNFFNEKHSMKDKALGKAGMSISGIATFIHEHLSSANFDEFLPRVLVALCLTLIQTPARVLLLSTLILVRSKSVDTHNFLNP